MTDALKARWYELLYRGACRSRDEYKAMVDECFAEIDRLHEQLDNINAGQGEDGAA